MRRAFMVVALVACAFPLTSRVSVGGQDSTIKTLGKIIETLRVENERLQQENKKLLAEIEKLRKEIANNAQNQNPKKADNKPEKKPENKLASALKGKWKHPRSGEIYIFTENGDYTHILPPVLTQGPVTTIGKYKFPEGNPVLNANIIEIYPKQTNATGFGATAALLKRSFHVEVDGDSLLMEQRIPLQAPRQELLRQK